MPHGELRKFDVRTKEQQEHEDEVKRNIQKMISGMSAVGREDETEKEKPVQEQKKKEEKKNESLYGKLKGRSKAIKEALGE